MRIPKKNLTAEQSRIREDLENQLKYKGLDGKYFQDLVEDYIFLLVKKDTLQEDIDENGVRITTYNSKGLPIEKKNESYDLLLKYNQQMIKILEYLGIKPSENTVSGGSDDELWTSFFCCKIF